MAIKMTGGVRLNSIAMGDVAGAPPPFSTELYGVPPTANSVTGGSYLTSNVGFTWTQTLDTLGIQNGDEFVIANLSIPVANASTMTLGDLITTVNNSYELNPDIYNTASELDPSVVDNTVWTAALAEDNGQVLLSRAGGSILIGDTVVDPFARSLTGNLNALWEAIFDPNTYIDHTGRGGFTPIFWRMLISDDLAYPSPTGSAPNYSSNLCEISGYQPESTILMYNGLDLMTLRSTTTVSDFLTEIKRKCGEFDAMLAYIYATGPVSETSHIKLVDMRNYPITLGWRDANSSSYPKMGYPLDGLGLGYTRTFYGLIESEYFSNYGNGTIKG